MSLDQFSWLIGVGKCHLCQDLHIPTYPYIQDISLFQSARHQIWTLSNHSIVYLFLAVLSQRAYRCLHNSPEVVNDCRQPEAHLSGFRPSDYVMLEAIVCISTLNQHHLVQLYELKDLLWAYSLRDRSWTRRRGESAGHSNLIMGYLLL